MRDCVRVVVIVSLFLMLVVGCLAYGAPAPLLKKEVPPVVPPRCVMKWMSTDYDTRFNPDGSYSAKTIGYDVTWVGTWQADPKKQLLFVREKILGEGDGAYLSWTIQMDPKMRSGWIGGYTLGSAPNLTLAEGK